MILYRETPEPAADLADVKAMARVEHDEDDNVVLGLIAIVTDELAVRTDTALRDQLVSVVYDDWSDADAKRLPISPLRLDVAALLTVHLGTVDISSLVTVAHGNRPCVTLKAYHGLTSSQLLSQLTITYTAGHGPAIADVPLAVRTAIATQAVHQYDQDDVEFKHHAHAPAFARLLKTRTRTGIA